jgi:hypothetical protein
LQAKRFPWSWAFIAPSGWAFRLAYSTFVEPALGTKIQIK